MINSDNKEVIRLVDGIQELMSHHPDWRVHLNPNNSSSGGSITSPGSGEPGQAGQDGKSLMFKWKGTQLGIKVEGSKDPFQFVELRGEDGETPYIDPITQRWFIGTQDTGIPANGSKGDKGDDGISPTFKVGTVTTSADGVARVNITGTKDLPVLNFEIPQGPAGDPATNTDEKVKLNSSMTNGQYLSDLIDGQTIVVDSTRNVIKVVNMEGLEASIATLNFVKNLDKDIMVYLSNVSNPMTFKSVVADDAELNAWPNPEEGDTFIVKSSASNGNKTMTFIYGKNGFQPLAETSVEVRDFSTDPLDLATESTGNVPASRVDPLIARLADVLDLAHYGGSDSSTVAQADKIKGLNRTPTEIEGLFANEHSHSNKSLLDNLIGSGTGDKFLTNNGTYVAIFSVSSTAPTNKGVLWIDDTSTTNKLLKYWNGSAWVAISGSASTTPTPPTVTVTVDSSMSATSNNPVQNKVVKKYVDDQITALDIPEVDPSNTNLLEERTNGLYVEDPNPHIDELQEEIRILRKSQHHVNTTLEYISVSIPYTTNPGENQVIPLRKRNNEGNMELDNNRVKLHAGKTYEIDTHISYSGGASDVWANIEINWVDVTHNTEIGEVRQYIVNDAKYEFNGSSSYIYTPAEDCWISLIVKKIHISDNIDQRSHASIREIGRAIEIDQIQQVNTNANVEDTPVGTIISVMGTKAPAHYLVCDGTEKKSQTIQNWQITSKISLVLLVILVEMGPQLLTFPIYGENS